MKLTKTMRTEVLTKVLKEVFEPKFNDLQKRLVVYGCQWLLENHPVFVELLARKDSREYLHTKHFYWLQIDDTRAFYPEYGIGYYGDDIKINEVTIPYHANSSLTVEDAELIKIYNTLHEQYREAYTELHSVLYSHSSREKLLADFPEYSKYLPVPPVTLMPAVIPSEARAKLSALGIPADVSLREVGVE